MNAKMTNCKVCGAEIAKNAKLCPSCGAKNKKPFYKKWWLWALIVVLVLSFGNSGNDTNSSTTTASDTSNPSQSVSTAKTSSTKAPVKTEYYVGDTFEDGNSKIIFVSSGDYIEENEYSQPAEGNKYIFLRFAVENISKSSDTGISSFGFECYADGYAANMYYGGEDELSATLSAGRSTTGYIYFEVPASAESIEVEYASDIFSDKKIKFIFEGEKDSGYVQPLNTVATEGEYKVGDIAESSRLKIAYLYCEEYISDNMFVVPADGNHFISCEFEFENIGTSDEYISVYDFDCYADGLSCNANYLRDDELGATLSAGRKTKGTVTFEVPVDAKVIEVEYLTNAWTSNRVVFTVK